MKLQNAVLDEHPDGKTTLRLWLRLLGSTNLIEGHLKSRLREHFGVTLAQFDLMSEIARDDTPKTMTEVSKLLMVSNGNVTGLVDRLSRDGLVRREPFAADRRVTLITLTSEGKTLFKAMAVQHEQWLSEIFEGFDTDFVGELADDVKKLRGGLKAFFTAEP